MYLYGRANLKCLCQKMAELLKRGVSSSLSYGEKFIDLRLADPKNLQICYLRIYHKILRFAISGLAHSRKFANLRLRNEPNNLRICGSRTAKKCVCPHMQQNSTLSLE
jgi:hypothetical protein